MELLDKIDTAHNFTDNRKCGTGPFMNYSVPFKSSK